MRELMIQVGHKIGADALTEAMASAAIGVGTGTLRKHLAGDYVRSDSAAKYRRWLQGEVHSPKAATPTVAAVANEETALPPWGDLEPAQPVEPFRVVDLFSGCGGLSLGFDLVNAGGAFETVLAVDIEQAMLDVHDDNRARTGRPKVGRLVDLADLTGEAEALAFYLDHMIRAGYGDESLRTALEVRPRGAMSRFLSSVAALDRTAAAGFRA
ncbi:MAG: cytosine methyltransferase, partial [Nocardioides sp.]|nr:cytosine methyltransferase [Nocardioides sp.]